MCAIWGSLWSWPADMRQMVRMRSPSSTSQASETFRWVTCQCLRWAHAPAFPWLVQEMAPVHVLIVQDTEDYKHLLPCMRS